MGLVIGIFVLLALLVWVPPVFLLLVGVGLTWGLIKAAQDKPAKNNPKPRVASGTPSLTVTTQTNPLPPPQSISNSDTDSFEGWFPFELQHLRVAASLKIWYKDRDGHETERDIQVKNLYYNEEEASTDLILAYCYLREANRTFRLSRVARCIDLDTGELVEDVKTHLLRIYHESPESIVDAFLKTSMDKLRVITFIAKADGRFTAKEKAVFFDYCQSALADERIQESHLKFIYDAVDPPSMATYKKLCKALSRSLVSTDKEALLNAAQGIAQAKKTISLSEQDALQILAKALA